MRPASTRIGTPVKRTVDDLRNQFGQALRDSSPQECRMPDLRKSDQK
jgi:hypothetical protein